MALLSSLSLRSSLSVAPLSLHRTASTATMADEASSSAAAAAAAPASAAMASSASTLALPDNVYAHAQQITPPATPNGSDENLAREAASAQQPAQQQQQHLQYQQQQEQMQDYAEQEHYDYEYDHYGIAIQDPPPVFHNFLRAYYAFHPSYSPADSTVTLPMNEGDVILVHSIHTNGWADGTLLASGARGWLPTNYCDAYEPEEMHNLLNALLNFWDLMRSTTVNDREIFANQEFIKGIIAGVRYLLERTNCLTREAAHIQRHAGLRRGRKSLLSELSALVKAAKRLQDHQRSPAPDANANDIIDDMIIKAFRIVTKAVRFFDILEEDRRQRAPPAVAVMATVLEESPPTPPADAVTFHQDDQKPAAAVEVSAAPAEADETTDDNDATVTLNNNNNNTNATTPTASASSSLPVNTPVNKHLSNLTATAFHTNNGRLSMSGSTPLVSHRLSSSSSISHRVSLAGPSPLSRPQNLVSNRLVERHDTFLSYLGSFIGRLHLQSQSRPNLALAIKQSAASGGQLLVVIDVVSAHSAATQDTLRAGRSAMCDRIVDLVCLARDILTNPLLPDVADVIMPHDNGRLLTAATDCVKATGECVAKTKWVIERVGDFEYEFDDATQAFDLDLSVLDAATEHATTPTTPTTMTTPVAANSHATMDVSASFASTVSVAASVATSVATDASPDDATAADSRPSTAGGSASGANSAMSSSFVSDAPLPAVPTTVSSPTPTPDEAAAAAAAAAAQLDGTDTASIAATHVSSSSPSKRTTRSTFSSMDKPLPEVPQSAADSPVEETAPVLQQQQQQQQQHRPTLSLTRPSSLMVEDAVVSATSMTSMASSAVSSLNHQALPPLPRLATTALPSEDYSPAEASASADSEFTSSFRSEALTAHSSGTPSTYASRDSESSLVSQTSTRATTPDHTNGPKNQPSMSELSTTGSATNTEGTAEGAAEDDVEAKLLERTYAHELMFNKEGQVTGGSLPALVERLTSHESTPDAIFVSTFYLTFRLFCTPGQLAEALIDRFDYVADSPHMAGPVRLRVYNAFKGWLESHWRDETDSAALVHITAFAESKLAVVLPSAGRRLLELAQRVQAMDGTLVPRLVSSMGKTNTAISLYVPADTPLPAPVLSKSLLHSLANWKMGGTAPTIMEVDPLEMARQLTLRQMAIFCSIMPEELLGSQWMKKSGRGAPNVKAMTALSTDLSNLVADTILQYQEVKKRAAVIKQWIKVAHQCFALHNYDALMAIICSLNSSTITRLRRTWEGVSVKRREMLKTLQAIVEPAQNNKVLRGRLHDHVPPCLPFLGMYLTDLTFVDIGNPATKQLPGQQQQEGGSGSGSGSGSGGGGEGGTSNGSAGLTVVNFDKHTRTARIIGDLQRFQIPYRLTEVPDLQEWIGSQISRVRELETTPGSNVQVSYYRKSLLLEPRETQAALKSLVDVGAGALAAPMAALAPNKETSSSKTDLFSWMRGGGNAGNANASANANNNNNNNNSASGAVATGQTTTTANMI